MNFALMLVSKILTKLPKSAKKVKSEWNEKKPLRKNRKVEQLEF